MRKADRWGLNDIINLEYLLKKDEAEQESSSPQDYVKRDREIYLRYINPLEKRDGDLTRGQVLMRWLIHKTEFEKKAKGADALLPGDIFLEIYTLVKYSLIVAGFIVGSAMVFSFLNYQGTEPLNVTAYLGGFILTQIFLLLLLMTMSIIRRFKNQTLRSSIIFILFNNLVSKLFHRIRKNRWRDLSAAQRQGLEAVLGVIRGKRLVYGSLFYWPVFILSQLFMVAFNVGILCATIFKVIGADIAFGWQSTIQVSPVFVFKLVEWIALPWSWFVPSGLAYPSLTQIEGSHMILKDGIYHLETSDLVSWWPFLCLALIFYGLLPRLLLLIFGATLERRRINTVAFNHEPCESLYRRMLIPAIDFTGCPDKQESPETYSTGNQGKGLEKFRMEPPKRTLLLLVPHEISDTLPEKGLLEIILKTTGYRHINKMIIDEEGIMDGHFLNGLSLSDKKGIDSDLLVIQEAWQPPIRETLGFIKKLSDIQGRTGAIMVGLIGKTGNGGNLTMVRDHEWDVWYKKIKSLGNPYISLMRLEPRVG